MIDYIVRLAVAQDDDALDASEAIRDALQQLLEGLGISERDPMVIIEDVTRVVRAP